MAQRSMAGGCYSPGMECQVARMSGMLAFAHRSERVSPCMSHSLTWTWELSVEREIRRLGSYQVAAVAVRLGGSRTGVSRNQYCTPDT